MLIRITSVLALLLSFSQAHAADSSLKRVYRCAYDGGADAYSWQITGEMGLPPVGSATCLKSDNLNCTMAVDAQGQELGQGKFCGTDANSQGDYPNTVVYDQ